MNEISSSERTSTVIIPIPIDLFEPFIRRGKADRAATESAPAEPDASL
jgi:hypothetical protein